MGEKQINRDDIIGLGDALDKLKLPEGQKALLSTIVNLASETLASSPAKTAVVDGTHQALSFRDQFASSFAPGRADADGDPPPNKIGHNTGP